MNPDAADREVLFADLERLVVVDPPAAVAMAETALTGVDAAGTMADRLRLRRMLVMAHAHTGQFGRALALVEESAQLPGAASAFTELARLRLASMQPLAHLDRVDDAIQAGQAALAMLEDGEQGALAGRAALNIGAIHAMTGHPDRALPFFDQALRYLGDEQVLLGQIETNRGTALAALDQFEAAEAAFARAASLLTTDEMSWAAAIAEGNLADLAARQGAINRSLRHFEASRRHLEADEAFGDLGRLNAEEAQVLAVSGLTTVARTAFSGAVTLLAEHGTPTDLASARIAYGAVLADDGAVAEATAMQEASAPLINADDQPEVYRQFLRLGARLALARGDVSAARTWIADGLAAVADLPVQQVRWMILQAQVHRLEGDGLAARAVLEPALEMAERVQVSPVIASIHEMLAEIAREAGASDAADDHARRAISAYEAIRGTIQADQVRQGWLQSRMGVYGALYLSLLAQDGDDAQAEAFGVAERIRSRTLLDAMQVRAADVDPVLSGTGDERPLIEDLAGQRRWLNWMYSALARGDEPTPLQLDELRERERLAGQLADRLAMLRPQPGFDTPRSLAEVRKSLPPGTTILSYLTVGERLTLQAIDATQAIGIADLAPVATVHDMVSALQFQIGRALASGPTGVNDRRAARLQRDVDAVLEQLYDLLVVPVASLLEGRDRLLVVPSGDLHSVPFAALRHEGGYLADRLAITTTPGVSVLDRMPRPAVAGPFAPRRPLLVGVGDAFAPGLRTEAEALSARYPAATVLLDERATQAAVLAAMPHADLIHLACHGRFDADHPESSGLKVADDWLTLDEVRDTRLDRPLVVLSGCETGRVRVDRGDDLVGLMAAMMTAGAGGLVTSLWKTHDTVAMALMDAFHDALAAGDDVATALRVSQQAIRARFGHAAWWAPFIGMQAAAGTGEMS